MVLPHRTSSHNSGTAGSAAVDDDAVSREVRELVLRKVQGLVYRLKVVSSTRGSTSGTRPTCSAHECGFAKTFSAAATEFGAMLEAADTVVQALLQLGTCKGTAGGLPSSDTLGDPATLWRVHIATAGGSSTFHRTDR
jgi:hypothetical protein